MALYRIADLVLNVDVRDALTESILSAYRVADGTPDLTITVSAEDVREEMEKTGVTSYGRCEATVVLRRLSDHLLRDFDGMFLHAAVIVYRGKAYAFVAPSGTGKSTHIRLWKTVFGNEVRVLNGDKPLIRRRDGRFIAYGSPWQGKENWGENTSCELAGVYLLRRGTEDRVTEVSPHEALRGMLAGTVVPPLLEDKQKLFDFLEAFLQTVDVCALYCTPTPAAVQAALSRMK